ncbi:MAG: nuclear transport factor 2 family protein [Steroidobacteraceae bacterium]
MNHRISMNRWMIVLAGTLISVASWLPVQAQESRWAKADELTAKSLINYERLWSESDCTHNGIEKTILAEDFQGTAPDGSRYSKQQASTEFSKGNTKEACEMYEVTVHFFGDAMAVLYGSESAVHVESDGRKHKVKLTWTDTWLKRHGIWQVVAAQDMPTEIK